MNDSIESVKTIFSRMLENLPIKREFKIRQAMFHWSDIVGEDIAAQSEPLKIEYRILWLGVNNSVWSHHLMMMKRQLIDKFNKYCAELLIEDIKFVNSRLQKRQAMLSGQADSEEDLRLSGHVVLDEMETRLIREAACLTADSELSTKAARLYRDDLALRRVKLKIGFKPCKICGVLSRNELCTVCGREERQGRRAKLRQLINELPWFTYAEINRQLPCSSYEYIAAKTDLLQLYADKLSKDEAQALESDELMMLTMLFRGVSCDKITDELMQKTYKKFRRRF